MAGGQMVAMQSDRAWRRHLQIDKDTMTHLDLGREVSSLRLDPISFSSRGSPRDARISERRGTPWAAGALSSRGDVPSTASSIGRSSIFSRTGRSSVLSKQLEGERERRALLEREVMDVRNQLAELQSARTEAGTFRS
mmetsp:Transcript_158959/g.281768  ORF Transcript_158959/g.281768 Transcript_158959/m.281768 type:complete len:138 (-) Transcript_158959:107-520(-)